MIIMIFQKQLCHNRISTEVLDVMDWQNLASVLQDPTWVLDIVAQPPNQVTATSGYGMGAGGGR